MKYIVLHLFVLLCCALRAFGSDIQEALDKGKPVRLEPGKTYVVNDTLVIKKRGQLITTRNSTPGDLSTYAMIKLASGSLSKIIKGDGLADVKIRNLIIDGNRREMKAPGGKIPRTALISLGNKGGDNPLVENCVVVDSRCGGGMAAIHVFEYSSGAVVRNNIIYGSGSDVLGNGRCSTEKSTCWGDGICTSSLNSIIENNLIVDATDEGIMIHGARGCKVRNNVIVAHSREMLAGIAILSTTAWNRTEKKLRFDYSGVVVSNNCICSLGSRIHMGIALGGATWSPKAQGKMLYGAVVKDNVLSGKAAGYGIVANGIEKFTITGNTSTATYSGIADGLFKKPPDDPGPFLYGPKTTIGCTLQKQFQPAQKHLVHVLRNFTAKAYGVNSEGCRVVTYEKPEANAIVTASFLDMTGKKPTSKELRTWSGWLIKNKRNADSLKRELLTHRNSKNVNSSVGDKDLLHLIIENGQKKISAAVKQSKSGWPDADVVFKKMYRDY